MKLSNQTQWMINGVIALIIAMFVITICPVIIAKIKFHVPINELTLSQIEFFALWVCAVSFFFCPKYYKIQVFTIFGAIIYYLIFRLCYLIFL